MPTVEQQCLKTLASEIKQIRKEMERRNHLLESIVEELRPRELESICLYVNDEEIEKVKRGLIDEPSKGEKSKDVD